MDGNELEVLLALRHKNEHYGSQMEALPDTVAFSQSFRNYFLIFFFEAEDGIRGKLVTGVQTCALPISGLRPDVANRAREEVPEEQCFGVSDGIGEPTRVGVADLGACLHRLHVRRLPGVVGTEHDDDWKIGRAHV